MPTEAVYRAAGDTRRIPRDSIIPGSLATLPRYAGQRSDARRGGGALHEETSGGTLQADYGEVMPRYTGTMVETVGAVLEG